MSPGSTCHWVFCSVYKNNFQVYIKTTFKWYYLPIIHLLPVTTHLDFSSFYLSFLPAKHHFFLTVMLVPFAPPNPSLFRSPFCQISLHLCDRCTHSEEAKSLFRPSLPRLRRFITVSNEQLDSKKWVWFPQFKNRISTGASNWGPEIPHSLIKFNEHPFLMEDIRLGGKDWNNFYWGSVSEPKKKSGDCVKTACHSSLIKLFLNSFLEIKMQQWDWTTQWGNVEVTKHDFTFQNVT